VHVLSFSLNQVVVDTPLVFMLICCMTVLYDRGVGAEPVGCRLVRCRVMMMSMMYCVTSGNQFNPFADAHFFTRFDHVLTLSLIEPTLRSTEAFQLGNADQPEISI
jgi:hypothetical protein